MHKVSLTYPSGASSEEGDRYSFVEIKREKVGGEEREKKTGRKMYKKDKRRQKYKKEKEEKVQH